MTEINSYLWYFDIFISLRIAPFCMFEPVLRFWHHRITKSLTRKVTNFCLQTNYRPSWTMVSLKTVRFFSSISWTMIPLFVLSIGILIFFNFSWNCCSENHQDIKNPANGIISSKPLNQMYNLWNVFEDFIPGFSIRCLQNPQYCALLCLRKEFPRLEITPT